MPVDDYGIPDDFNVLIYTVPDFPGGSDGKEFACSAEDADLISGLGRSLERVQPTPALHWNPTDREGAW